MGRRGILTEFWWENFFYGQAGNWKLVLILTLKVEVTG